MIRFIPFCRDRNIKCFIFLYFCACNVFFDYFYPLFFQFFSWNLVDILCVYTKNIICHFLYFPHVFKACIQMHTVFTKKTAPVGLSFISPQGSLFIISDMLVKYLFYSLSSHIFVTDKLLCSGIKESEIPPSPQTDPHPLLSQTYLRMPP